MENLTRVKRILKVLSNIPNDKLLHSFYGTLVYLALSTINPVFGLFCVLFLAFAKEVYDELDYGGFDSFDILATILVPFLFFIKEYICNG